MTPTGIRGLRHVALNVSDIRTSQTFYERIFGMRVVWQPDATSVYLSSGIDNLALHQLPPDKLPAFHGDHGQRLDHFGFLMESPESVDAMFRYVQAEGVPVVKPPKRHRDGSYSFYISDPDNNIVQILFEPTVSQHK
ncbi:MAG: VOC family protein [Nitrospirae bacterium]|nr:MAG: VOC family protein [Nitrospirota bacterium]